MEKYNVIYDDTVVKYTINLPVKMYERITAVCKERRVPKSVLIREALDRSFNTTFTAKELIQYEVMRHLGEIKSDQVLPEKCTTSSARTEHGHFFRKYPGFVAGLQKNSFVYNLFHRENMES